MTFPITTILPLHSEKIKEGGDKLDAYMRELVFTLQNQYEDIAQAINGDTRTNTAQDNRRWIPVVGDSADADTTFTYDTYLDPSGVSQPHQIGWVLRKGIMVDLWFDVKWLSVASGTVNGNIEIDLPYKVAITEQKPFVGVVQSSVFTYTAGTECVINARPDSYLLDVFNVGDGFTTANQGSVAAGHLIGNIRYVGQGLERS